MKPGIKKYTEKAEFYTEEKCFVNELSNTSDDEDVSIAKIRVLPGVTTNWHRLKDTTERYVILAGSGIVEISDLPGQAVCQGDVVVIPPMFRQRITNIGKTDLIFLAVCTPRFTADLYEDLEERNF
ncbi:MAG: cupin domain-containing protein [Candidatus Cloacimonadales bacterium]|nr:cupin domain-containing protein [Candidatus Cloacimonadales bacterium]